MIRPGQRCLIVCLSTEHRFSGWECVAKEFLGKDSAISPNGVLQADDWWRVEIPGAEPLFNLPFGARAAWLVPLDDNEDQFIRESIKQALEDGIAA